MTRLRISRDISLRAWFFRDALWHHQDAVRDFPLPLLIRYIVRWHSAPAWVQTLAARFALWRLDRSFRPSVEKGYALLRDNVERIDSLTREVEEAFGRPLKDPIRLTVSPHEWALSSEHDISIGIRPPEMITSFPVKALRHELIHIAYAHSLPVWEEKGLHLYHSQEALEIAVAMLSQRMAHESDVGIDIDYLNIELRPFAELHRKELVALLKSHDSPASLLESVDRLVDEYIHAKA